MFGARPLSSANGMTAGPAADTVGAAFLLVGSCRRARPQAIVRGHQTKERSLQRQDQRPNPGGACVKQNSSADAPVGGETRKRRILVVDDNDDAVESLAILLEMMSYDVRTASDGIQAVEVAAAFSPDVVLLDIGLPGIDGYEAAKRIRALDGGDAVYLVALTGWGQEDDLRRSREAGFDHHLVKPVDPDTIEDVLRRVTETR
jgi:CheY-like chemotaxis protein